MFLMQWQIKTAHFQKDFPITNNRTMDELVSSQNQIPMDCSSSSSQLAKALIERLHQEYLDTNEFSLDLLAALYHCFGNTFERALKQVDSKPLILYKSTAGSIIR
uniref:Uncharacterized protein n=1 Tax=Cacopsylla melanoneura TaxID=428564 RepID=A0A8D8S601_9HEMI